MREINKKRFYTWKSWAKQVLLITFTYYQINFDNLQWFYNTSIYPRMSLLLIIITESFLKLNLLTGLRKPPNAQEIINNRIIGRGDCSHACNILLSIRYTGVGRMVWRSNTILYILQYLLQYFVIFRYFLC